MAYCRFGEDSDVYTLHTGVWVTYVSKTVSEDTIQKLGGSYFQDRTPLKCLQRLLDMREKGLLVPGHAITRLTKEAAQLARNEFISPR